MKDEDCLFIISTVELKEKTEKDLMVEYEVYKLKYPFWANKSYERFCDFQKEWHWNKYSFKEEDNSYFTDIREAKSFVEGNFADINDGGIYDYALIKDYDWLFLKQYFKPQTRKGQVEYLIISQISSCYYFLICYLKIRHKMFR